MYLSYNRDTRDIENRKNNKKRKGYVKFQINILNCQAKNNMRNQGTSGQSEYSTYNRGRAFRPTHSQLCCDGYANFSKCASYVMHSLHSAIHHCIKKAAKIIEKASVME